MHTHPLLHLRPSHTHTASGTHSPPASGSVCFTGSSLLRASQHSCWFLLSVSLWVSLSLSILLTCVSFLFTPLCVPFVVCPCLAPLSLCPSPSHHPVFLLLCLFFSSVCCLQWVLFLPGAPSLLSCLLGSLNFSLFLSLSPACGDIFHPHIPKPGWGMRAGNGPALFLIRA